MCTLAHLIVKSQTVLPLPGIPKAHAITERASNQQLPSGSAGPHGAAAASKLPVKGLTRGLSFSSPENNETNRAITKGGGFNHSCSLIHLFNTRNNSHILCLMSAASASTTATSPNERPSRSSAKPVHPPSTGDTAISAPCGVPKLHVMRSRSLTLQAKTSAPSE